MTRELRKILDIIDAALVKQDETAQELWAVITAQRGPDKDEFYIDADGVEHTLKSKLTVPIRRAAFPESAGVRDGSYGASYINGAYFGSEQSASTIATPFYPQSHFELHARNAGLALGIEENLR